MRKAFCASVGIISGLAGLLFLPYLFMALHELSDVLGGQLSPDIPKWDPYAAVGISGALSSGAFFMAYRFLRYATLDQSKPTNRSTL